MTRSGNLRLILVTFFFQTILISLGGWQVLRYFQQQNRMLYANSPDIFSLSDLKDKPRPYTKVMAEGIYDHGKSFFMTPRTHQGEIGGYLYTPLHVDGKFLLVRRGWLRQKDFLAQKYQSPLGLQQVSGILYYPEKPSLFHVKNNPAQQTWHVLDLNEVAAFHKIDLYPFVVAESRTKVAEEIHPIPLNLKTHIPHRLYATIWFSLAGVLLIYYLLLRKKGKRVRNESRSQ